MWCFISEIMHQSEGAIRYRNAPKFDCVISFKVVEIGVGCRMAQCSTHCYNLALVMKGMGKEMVKDERRSTDGDISIREIKFGVAVKLAIRQS
jgi:hypothetical protein